MADQPEPATSQPAPSAPSPSPGTATPSVAAAGAPPPTAPTPAAGMSRRKKIILVVVALIAIHVFALLIVPAIWRSWTTESTDDAYVNGHVTFVAPRVAGQVTRVFVDDNNRVNRGERLVELDKEPFEISLRLSQAQLESALANLVVAKDQLRGVVAQARSNRFRLEHAMEDVRNQLSLLRSQVAQQRVTEANLVLAKADFERGEKLIKTNAISKQDFDRYQASLDVAKNQVEAAIASIQQTRASLGLGPNVENPLDVPPNLDQEYSAVRQALAELIASVAPLGVYPETYVATPKQIIEEFYRRDPEGNLDRIYDKLIKDAPALKEAQAKVDAAQSEHDQAKLNLKWCDVVAEIDGVVTRRNVNPGNNVEAGQNLMAVRSLTEIWIDANFKETQLSEMRIGHQADVYVDLYGSRRMFSGRITGFTMGTGSTLALLPAQNATGNFVKVVQRLPVRIELTNYNPDEDPLFVGLSVVPYVYFREPPSGPDAGKVLQPPLMAGAIGSPPAPPGAK